MDAEIIIINLSEKLELNYESQDWGIINADPDSVSEFLNLYKERGSLNKFEGYHLCELIIASFNEAILEKKVTDKMLFKFKNFVAKNRNLQKVVFDYWRSLYSNEEFPVADLLTDA